MVVRSRQPGSSGSSTTMAAPPWGWVGKGWYFCCCCCCRYSCCYCCVVTIFFYCFCSVICFLLLMVLMLENVQCSINKTLKYFSMIANLKLASLLDSSIVSLSLHELCHQLCYFHPCRSYLNPSWEIVSDFAGFVKWVYGNTPVTFLRVLLLT